MDGQRGKDGCLTSSKVSVVTSRPPGLVLEPKERDVQWTGCAVTQAARQQWMDLTSQNKEVHPHISDGGGLSILASGWKWR